MTRRGKEEGAAGDVPSSMVPDMAAWKRAMASGDGGVREETGTGSARDGVESSVTAGTAGAGTRGSAGGGNEVSKDGIPSIIEVLFPSREVFEFSFRAVFLGGGFFEKPSLAVLVDFHAVPGGCDKHGLGGFGGGFPVAEVGFGALDVVGLEDAFFVDARNPFLGEVNLVAGYGAAHDGLVNAVAAFFLAGLVVGQLALPCGEGVPGDGNGPACKGQFAAGTFFAEGSNPQQAL